MIAIVPDPTDQARQIVRDVYSKLRLKGLKAAHARVAVAEHLNITGRKARSLMKGEVAKVSAIDYIALVGAYLRFLNREAEYHRAKLAELQQRQAVMEQAQCATGSPPNTRSCGNGSPSDERVAALTASSDALKEFADKKAAFDAALAERRGSVGRRVSDHVNAADAALERARRG